ncbi:MAG TPA: peptide ABC transporter substrate-binding protein [Candidatus Polarisedimenticolia bacterium]|nr:peptide ABC transporter substrate-binding protein [Candidatus Polarisedimenticolia bacterium]
MHKRSLAVLGLFAVIATACGSGTITPEPSTGSPSSNPSPSPTAAGFDLFHTTYSPDEGADGGQIIIGDWQEANQFNPFYLGQVTEANVASAAWASLVVLTPDLKYAPDLATEVPTLENGGVTVPGDNGDAMTVTWELRSGLKWSDGEPLTCDDFKYAQEWVLDPENVGVVTAGYDVSTPECLSDTTFVQHFSEIFEGYILLNVAPLPRHYLEAIPMADQVNGAGFRATEVADLPVSGAFKFESVTPLAELRLVKNPNYTSFATGKPAHLDTLIWKWYGDADLMIAGFSAGEIDFATDLQDSDLPKLANLPPEQVSAIPALTYEFLRPNWSDGPFITDANDPNFNTGGCSRNPVVQDRGAGCPMSDPAVRASIAYAIDKDEINERLLGGLVQIANTSITPNAWFYADQPPATFDPEKAKQLLEDAGWKDSDGDGVREKDGTKLKIELCTTTRQVRIDTLGLVADWLADVGFEAIPNPVPAADIFADYNEATVDTPCALSKSNFDLAEHAFTSSIDPLGSYFSYHSSQFEPNGVNDAQVVDDGIDAALDAVKDSVDFGVIKDAMVNFQQIYAEKTVEIPLYYRKQVDLVAPNVGNFFANPTQAGPTWNAVDWYVKG